MHEGNFTKRIVESIMEELKKHPRYVPKRVKVKVGEIFHLNPESVKMHYVVVTKGTPLEGTELDLIEEKITVYCWQCSRTGTVLDHHFLACSCCNSTDVEVMSGNQVSVDSVELVNES
ncbi:MAG: hydrogenase maturation nickel metallochaperone HypA [Candidatus Omnitrophica bacterium]|nr:hydrogenase maturation nickel metallochaperone HypA [Candidatus Omnitrophota bacterium]